LFTDPITITINAVANDLPRVEQAGKKSVYQKSDGSLILTLSHQAMGSNRTRGLTRLDERLIVTDPLTSVNDYETATVFTVIERPLYGFSVTQIQQLVAGHVAFLTNANVAKLYGQES